MDDTSRRDLVRSGVPFLLVVVFLCGLAGCGSDVVTPPHMDAGHMDAASDVFVFDTAWDHNGRVPINHRPNADACSAHPDGGTCTLPPGSGAAQCQHDAQCPPGVDSRCVLSGGP